MIGYEYIYEYIYVFIFNTYQSFSCNNVNGLNDSKFGCLSSIVEFFINVFVFILLYHPKKMKNNKCKYKPYDPTELHSVN